MKYPRTPHLSFSPGATRDDRMLPDDSCFEGQEVVVTEKLDGSSCALTRSGIHARSESSVSGPIYGHLKALQANTGYLLDDDEGIFGEYVYAKHSISYSNLTSFFYVFGIVVSGAFLSWDDLVAECDFLGLEPVPVFYRGIWDEDAVKACYGRPSFGPTQEGFVVRLVGSFRVKDFGVSVAKYVRANHVETTEHWTREVLVPNRLEVP